MNGPRRCRMGQIRQACVRVVHNYDANGSRFRDLVRLDDSTNPKRFATLNDNQKFWAIRWSDQMNYPYWKQRSQAEMTEKGVTARQLFYEGTMAYNPDFVTAAAKFKEGLPTWDALRRTSWPFETTTSTGRTPGSILKRYMRVLGQQSPQAGNVVPDDLPFKELLQGPAPDDSPDPFDA